MKANTQMHTRRRAFTLIEMLVAVALVLLMMSMFAAVFQEAGAAVSTQRGVAENDQRARSVFSILRADLQKRTFRNVVPFLRNENSITSPFAFGPRRGYFYISTNNPDDNSDDLVQFTVDTNITIESDDRTPYFGRCVQLTGGGGGTVWENFVSNPNQPESDDGEVYPNNTGSSPAAEVSYFVRGGNLYRIVRLIRDPIPQAGSELEAQPTRADLDYDGNGQLDDPLDFFDLDADPVGTTDYPHVGATGRFWADFDYSAFREFDPGTGSPVSAAKFVGTDALNNEPVGSTFYSLGKPTVRFGHSTQTGLSREHIAVVDPQFLGRFVMAELSSDTFLYPQDTTVIGDNPMDIANPVTLDPEFRTVTEFPAAVSGSRRSEDLLLANVREFKIEVWDDRISQFVVPGNSLGGDFDLSRRRNAGYGPFDAADENADPTADEVRVNRVVDTWHPGLGGNAPYRPMSFYAPGAADGGAWWAPGGSYSTEDADGDGVLDPGEDGTNGFPANGRLDFDVVFPRTEDVNGDGFFDAPTEDGANGLPVNVPPQLDSEAPSVPFGFAYYYRCIQPGDAGMTAPGWQARPGAVITEDSDNDGVAGGPNAAVWQAVPNLRPVRAIRLTIRFIDPTTEQSRQVTIVHSLLD